VPAYIVLNGRYFDPDRTAMQAYTARVRPTMAAYGGDYHRTLAQRLEVLEGSWHPRSLGIVKFPTFEQARAWYHSPEYAPLKAIRLAHARNDTILVDALADEQAYESRPMWSDAERDRLDAFFAEAERRGIPPDRFRPGVPLEAAVAEAAAEPAASPAPTTAERSAALERVLALLPTLDPAGRRRVVARCRELDAAPGDASRA
jgi:uncharacterized protein (DUF1330 family)